MVDIAGNILAAGRQVPRPSNLLANRAALEGQRIQNSLGEQALGINKDVNQRAATAATQKERDYAKLQIAQAMNAIAQSQDPLTAARNITSNPQFAQFAQQLGIAPERFEIGPEVTPDIIKQAAINMSTELGGPAYGQLANTDLSSNFRNYLAYSQMPPEQRELYEAANRQRQVIETGAGDAVLGPQGPKVIPGAEAEALATRAANEAAQVATAEVGARNQQEMLSEQISDGYAAADAIPVLSRGIELLEEGVRTGGYSALALWAANRLGITGADEGELSANLGKAVLSQLRSTFGAQFTQQEGERLQEIEAGFGKSVEVNIRLLQQARAVSERAARRGIAAARRARRPEDVAAIQEAMNMKFDYEQGPLVTATGPNGEKAVLIDGEWVIQ